ncbi:UPAR/Ly6 domain-containing protein bero [Haematobia irritans]|uniref:UPAR/Ly6 domain-containing protein bero n=1 Tax=Haematobia irritans TaxID=7368 RepID=UPI003F4FD26C
MNQMHLIFTSVLISSLFISASAIECYSCESAYEQGCGYIFDSEEYFKVNCDRKAPPRYIQQSTENLNATACMKRVYKEHSVTKYIRSCYFGDVNDTDTGCRMDPSMIDIHDVQCYVCDEEDYCNAASRNHDAKTWWSTFLPMLIFILTAKILNMKCF